MGEMEIFSVGVKNVQSIESLEFEFPVRDSGGSFVTLVGPSSSGKSALLRAVHALINNTSSAAVLLRSGAKKFEVGATFKNSYVKIERGASLSTYTLGSDKYTKSGTSVPDDIAKSIGFKDPDLHLRFQFDRPYLLDATSGQAATALSRLSHAHILRDAASKASKIVRQKSSEASVLESEKASAEQALADLGDVEAQGEAVAAIKEQAEALKSSVSRAAQVQTALTLIADRASAQEAAQRTLEGIPDLSEEFAALREGVDWFDEVSREVRKYEQAVENSSHPVPDIARHLQPLVASTNEKISLLHSASSLLQKHDRSFSAAYTAHQEWDQAKKDLQVITDEVEFVRSSLKVCPTCGQEVGAA